MKAFIVDRYGSADRVRASEVPDPEVRDDDVLIEMHAAGVNPLDSKIRDGEFKLFLPYRLPLILGNELAGVVIRVGSRVRRFKPGDEVNRPKRRWLTSKRDVRKGKSSSRFDRRSALPKIEGLRCEDVSAMRPTEVHSRNPLRHPLDSLRSEA